MEPWESEEWDEDRATPRPWGPYQPFGTEDAARIGLDQNTFEGAQLAFFSHLDGRKVAHKVVAWVALLVLVAWPLFLTLTRIFGA